MSHNKFQLPAALEAAIGHVQAVAAAAAQRVVAQLADPGPLIPSPAERAAMHVAHTDLRLKLGSFTSSLDQTLRARVADELAPRHASHRTLDTVSWETLSLVEDTELESRMLADRIGQAISHACEVPLRDLAMYMGGLLDFGWADEERNPLRPEVIGRAVCAAIETVTDDADARKLLVREFGQMLSKTMPEAYTTIVRDMQARHVKPAGLAVRTVHGPGQTLPGVHSGYDSLRQDLQATRPGPSDYAPMTGHFAGRSRGYGPSGPGSDALTQPAGFGSSGSGRTAPRSAAGARPGSTSSGGGFDSRPAGMARSTADAELISLLRRLTYLASRPGALDAAPLAATSTGGFGAPSTRSGRSGAMGLPSAQASTPGGLGYDEGVGVGGLMAVNLIRAHREELLQASPGKLDHMVIDVVGSLFDQILSDTRVPPQMARQIARLQLPVLRVALSDSSFFSSRRHPVRRFVNRIGSLACAFDEFDDGPGKELLDRVRELVQEIVDGDFDQLEIYTAKLTALENFIAGQSQAQVEGTGAASLLENKESELRVQQRYMAQLQTALAPVSMPAYLREFVSQVWSQALVAATRKGGADSDLARRLREAGRDLVLSVQPKGSREMRKRFLMQLPALMKNLNEGMKLIGWPEAAQKSFFGQLLPSHADSLKAPPISELDHNLLAKQLDSVFAASIPGSYGDIPRAEHVAFAEAEIEQRFSPEEAQQVGLVDESAVDWSGEIDIDLSVEAPEEAADSTDAAPLDLGVDINLDLVAADPAEPSRGPQLFDHVRLGFAYQMLLKDQWQKVRLSYVSPGRSFFVFTRGRKHQETISLTARMLARMCEAGRMRAVESAYLMERATARARRQLAALKAAPSRH